MSSNSTSSNPYGANGPRPDPEQDTLTAVQASSVAAPIPTATPALGGRVKRGFVWMFAQTLGNKVIATLGQIALARLIVPEDWGAVALVLAFTSFAQVLNDTGVRDILIQRQKRFHLWVTPAAWLAAASGILGGLFILIVGPVVATFFFKDSSLVPMMWALAIVPLIDAVTGISQAKIQIDLRFRAMAMVAGLSGAGQVIAAVLFAALGLGPWSWILARLILSLGTCVWSWSLSGVRIGRRPQVRRWKYLIANSLRLIATGISTLVAYQAGNLVLGRMHDKEVVGQFYFAFNLSVSIMIPITMNVGQVLMPSMSRIKDDLGRLRSAYFRASRLFVFIVTPVTFAVAATAEPFIRLLFSDRWIDSIPVMQIMSLGMAMKCGELPAMNALKALGRFDRVLEYYASLAILSLIGVFIGASMGEAVAGAAGMCIAWCVTSPLAMVFALRRLNASLWTIIPTYAIPVLVALPTSLLGLWGGEHVEASIVSVDPDPHHMIVAVARVIHILVTGGIGVGLYALGMWYLQRPLMNEIVLPIAARLRR